uniref:PLU-1 domain-containing protein n=1 Tax=Steinernema glaseri TaxID=37863 RepID=A0A1I8ATR2_9BILA
MFFNENLENPPIDDDSVTLSDAEGHKVALDDFQDVISKLRKSWKDLSLNQLEDRVASEACIAKRLEDVLREKTNMDEETVIQKEWTYGICKYVADLEKWKIRLHMSDKLEQIRSDMRKLKRALNNLQDKQQSDDKLTREHDGNEESVQRNVREVHSTVLRLLSNCRFTFDDVKPLLGSGIISEENQNVDPQREDHTMRARELRVKMHKICERWTEEDVISALSEVDEESCKANKEYAARVEEDEQRIDELRRLSIDLRICIAKDFGNSERAAVALYNVLEAWERTE